MHNWVIIAVSKHVIAEDALTGGRVGICIDESTHLWIVITGLEVVERGLSVLCLPLDIRNSDYPYELFTSAYATL